MNHPTSPPVVLYVIRVGRGYYVSDDDRPADGKHRAKRYTSYADAEADAQFIRATWGYPARVERM